MIVALLAELSIWLSLLAFHGCLMLGGDMKYLFIWLLVSLSIVEISYGEKSKIDWLEVESLYLDLDKVESVIKSHDHVKLITNVGEYKLFPSEDRDFSEKAMVFVLFKTVTAQIKYRFADVDFKISEYHRTRYMNPELDWDVRSKDYYLYHYHNESHPNCKKVTFEPYD